MNQYRNLGVGIMGIRVALLLALICFHGGDVAAQNQDYAALSALTKDWENLPESWTGADPCGSKWEGITCKNSRIVAITLSSVGLTGQLTGDLVSLSELQILDLSYNKGLTGSLPSTIGELSQLTNLILLGCGLTGIIPDSIGSLEQLVYLSLNSNGFTGKVPASIGNLKKLYWLDLSDNKLTGGIPVSSGDGTTHGLDLLVNTKHFHFGQNQLSGVIPPSLFSSNMTLIHVLFDNNKLTGSIPSTLGLVQALEALRFDRNSLSGPLPSNLNNLTHLNELMLSNNAFSGPVPDLTGMNNLNLVDMSNNSFAATEVPGWLTTLQSLTTIMMEHTGLEGQLPDKFFSIPQLQTVMMRSNRLNGTLDIGSGYSSQLQLIDLQSNAINSLTVTPGFNFTLRLADNPFCNSSAIKSAYCNNQQDVGSSYSTPVFCVPPKCPSGQTSSPVCKCAYPYTGTLTFRAPSFSASGNPTHFTNLQQSLLQSFVSFKLPVDSISLSDIAVDSSGYLNMHLAIFPAGINFFNKTGVLSLGFVLSNQTYKPSKVFGPYVFIADNYAFGGNSATASNRKSANTGIIIGAIVGGSVLLLLLIGVGSYAYCQRKARNAKPEANLINNEIVELKGARFFSFEELQKCTNNFSEDRNIGAGGYGKVYKGILGNGQIVAIKRSQLGSSQGSREFKNEIELLSRVHHKNLVSLVGFCYAQGEQMLVYEYIPNGTLSEALLGESGIQLDWSRRLMVALGAARGLQYLHELADPPIIHRDIKSNNILLDQRLVAKVADFGLSKLFGDTEKGYVTTQVKGTLGYLDPEYYMTNQVTEKSDVFSFGVVMLEMVTARTPIKDGKYVVREIKTAIDRTKPGYNLGQLLDPSLLRSSTTHLVGFEKFVDLALNCVNDSGTERPTMGEVMKEIEGILKGAGLNPNAESAPVSQTYNGGNGGGFGHPYSDNSLFQYSDSISLTKAEPR